MVKEEEFFCYMEEICNKNQIRLKEEQISKFWTYYKELQRWNRVHNLTAVEDWKETVKRHFCDSLTLVRFFEDIGYTLEGKCLVDVGSGAGFPGVPLKIYYPPLEVHLIESISKKCSFLTYLKTRLGLDYKVHCRLAEEVNLKCHIAVARALEVKGKKVDPLVYADKLLTSKAKELVVILKGKELNPLYQKLGYKVYKVPLEDFKDLKILYKFL